jgi:hypothetical protein
MTGRARLICVLSACVVFASLGCSKSNSGVSITISPAGTGAVSSLLPGQQIVYQANIPSSESYADVGWSLTPNIGTLVCQPLATREGGCATVTYIAPIALLTSFTETLTANYFVSGADRTVLASASASFGVDSSGTLDFLFSGFDPNGSFSAAGTFSVNPTGNIQGEEDFKDTTTQNPSPQTISGICQSLAGTVSGFCRFNAGGQTFQYDYSMESNFELAHFTEDPSDGLGISGSGILIPQTSSVALDFLDDPFGMIGTDASGGRMGIVGATSQQLPGPITGQADINDGGALIQPSSSANNLSASTTAVDQFGRQVVQMIVGSTPQRVFTLAVYSISETWGFAIDITSATPTSKAQVLVGEVGKNYPFYFDDNTLFSGANVFDLSGVTPGGAATTAIGTISPLSTPNLLMDVNVAGSVNGGAGAAAAETGSVSGLTVSNGRAQFSTTVNGVNSNYIAYSDLLLGTDTNVSFGFLRPQTSPPYFGNTGIMENGVTGTFLPASATVPNVASTITLTPTTPIGTTFSTGTLSSGITTGSYSFDAVTGRGTVNISTGSILGNNSAVFYIVDPNDIVLMGSQPGQSNDGIEFLEGPEPLQPFLGIVINDDIRFQRSLESPESAFPK